jgi:hypothetical protein
MARPLAGGGIQKGDGSTFDGRVVGWDGLFLGVSGVQLRPLKYFNIYLCGDSL